VDPDGDRVRLVGVGVAEDPRVAVSITSNGAGVEVSALDSAEPGVHSVEYTVRDDFGGVGTGLVRIIVAPTSEDGRAPIVSTDYVRLVSGSEKPARVRPLDNDIDPANGRLTI